MTSKVVVSIFSPVCLASLVLASSRPLNARDERQIVVVSRRQDYANCNANANNGAAWCLFLSEHSHEGRLRPPSRAPAVCDRAQRRIGSIRYSVVVSRVLVPEASVPTRSKQEISMALVLHRRLALPLWVMAFFTLALTAPPSLALLPILIFGMALMAFTMTGPVPPWRTFPSFVRIASYGSRQTEPAVARVSVGTCVRTPYEPYGAAAEDALDLVRLDDDGGWQKGQPPA
jgi:hypothetical protein